MNEKPSAEQLHLDKLEALGLEISYQEYRAAAANSELEYVRARNLWLADELAKAEGLTAEIESENSDLEDKLDKSRRMVDFLTARLKAAGKEIEAALDEVSS